MSFVVFWATVLVRPHQSDQFTDESPWHSWSPGRKPTDLARFLQRQDKNKGYFWERCEELEEIFPKVRGPGVYWRDDDARYHFAMRCFHKNVLCQSMHESCTPTHTDAALKPNTCHLTSWVTPMSAADSMFPKTEKQEDVCHCFQNHDQTIGSSRRRLVCRRKDWDCVCHSSSETKVNWRAVMLPGWI